MEINTTKLTQEHAGVGDDEQCFPASPIDEERGTHGNEEVVDLG